MVPLALVLTLLVSQSSAETVAQEILATLEGEWEFTLGSRTGTRTVRTVFPGILVAWSEVFDGGGPRGEGFVGYDATEGSFFSISVHDVPGAYGMSIGELDAGSRAITYEPVRLGGGERPHRVVFRMMGEEQFNYTMFERAEDGSWVERWTARFRRRGEPRRP